MLTDEGPSSSSNFPLSARDPNGPSVTLHAVSDDVLYVLAPPEFARYDVAAREFAFQRDASSSRTSRKRDFRGIPEFSSTLHPSSTR